MVIDVTIPSAHWHPTMKHWTKIQCSKCGKVGHLAHKCNPQPSTRNARGRNGERTQARRTEEEEDSDWESNEEEEEVDETFWRRYEAKVEKSMGEAKKREESNQGERVEIVRKMKQAVKILLEGVCDDLVKKGEKKLEEVEEVVKSGAPENEKKRAMRKVLEIDERCTNEALMSASRMSDFARGNPKAMATVMDQVGEFVGVEILRAPEKGRGERYALSEKEKEEGHGMACYDSGAHSRKGIMSCKKTFLKYAKNIRKARIAMWGFQKDVGKLEGELEGDILMEIVAKNMETGEEEIIYHLVTVAYVPGAVEDEIIVPLRGFVDVTNGEKEKRMTCFDTEAKEVHFVDQKKGRLGIKNSHKCSAAADDISVIKMRMVSKKQKKKKNENVSKCRKTKEHVKQREDGAPRAMTKAQEKKV